MIPMRQRIFRAAIHIPVGLLNIAATLVHWSAALVFCLSFLAYELNEDRHIKDQAWYDLTGYLIGQGAMILYLLWLA